MAWIRIDDHAPEHRKLLKAGTSACWLWVCGLAWCSRHLTNGDLPREAIWTFGVKGTATAAARLVDVGLWDVTPDGYRIHDYLAYQPSDVQVKKRRHANAARLETWRIKNGYVGGNADVTALQTQEKQTCVHTPVPVPVPYPVPVPHNQRSKNTITPAAFLGFWMSYPRKVGKVAALKAWTSLNPSQTVIDQMGEALTWQIHQPQWTKDSGAFIPHPATWLRSARWMDEPLPQAGAKL